MNRSRHATSRGRLLVGALMAFGGLAVTAPAAFGHAAFRSARAVPPASEQSISMHVPVERADAHNTKIIVQVPAGFEVRQPCPPKADWKCEVTPPGGSRKETLVTWERTAGTTDPDDLFGFSAQTPGEPGSYAFKVNQIYSSKENVAWHGEPASEFPAPVLEVR